MDRRTRVTLVLGAGCRRINRPTPMQPSGTALAGHHGRECSILAKHSWAASSWTGVTYFGSIPSPAGSLREQSSKHEATLMTNCPSDSTAFRIVGSPAHAFRCQCQKAIVVLKKPLEPKDTKQPGLTGLMLSTFWSLPAVLKSSPEA